MRVVQPGREGGSRTRVDRLRRRQAFQGGGGGREVVGEPGRGAEHVGQAFQQGRVVLQQGEQLHAGGQAVEQVVQVRHGVVRLGLARDGGLDQVQNLLLPSRKLGRKREGVGHDGSFGRDAFLQLLCRNIQYLYF